jgi:hypothetical protein
VQKCAIDAFAEGALKHQRNSNITKERFKEKTHYEHFSVLLTANRLTNLLGWSKDDPYARHNKSDLTYNMRSPSPSKSQGHPSVRRFLRIEIFDTNGCTGRRSQCEAAQILASSYKQHLDILRALEYAS